MSAEIEVGATVRVAVGERRGCLAVVQRLHPPRYNQKRQFWWLVPVDADAPSLGFYETAELELVSSASAAGAAP
jgi:hypothetical protein